MSVKGGKDGNQLPPTIGTLVPHVSRAYYHALMGKMSTKPQFKLPAPTGYHWVIFYDNPKLTLDFVYLQEVTNEGKYMPIMCINPSSPLELLELKSCKCTAQKNRCGRLSCPCFKNGLQCCDFCECGEECENLPDKKSEIEDSEDFLI